MRVSGKILFVYDKIILPAGWEPKKTSDGKQMFYDHNRLQSHSLPPPGQWENELVEDTLDFQDCFNRIHVLPFNECRRFEDLTATMLEHFNMIARSPYWYDKVKEAFQLSEGKLTGAWLYTGSYAIRRIYADVRGMSLITQRDWTSTLRPDMIIIAEFRNRELDERFGYRYWCSHGSLPLGRGVIKSSRNPLKKLGISGRTGS